MSSPSPSSSPRWDNRNSGFVSPSQLQQWKREEQLLQQQHELQRRQFELGLQQHQPLYQPQQAAEAEDKLQVREADLALQLAHREDQHLPPAPVPPSTHFEAAPPSPQPEMFRTTSRVDSTMPQSQPASATPTHNRTSSAFSIFKRPGHHSQPSTSSLNQSAKSSPATTPAEEFGHRHTPSTVSQLTSSSNSRLPLLPAGNGDQPTSPNPVQQAQAAPPPQAPVRTSTVGPPPDAPPPPLHPEIRSVVGLTIAHGRKVYFSGPLVRRQERQPDGQRPTKDEGWRDVWAHLGGTTLSLWDMKEIEEARKEGKQAPPSYINVTDAFVQVLGSVTVPATADQPAKKYTNVLTLNTAGSNLLLFTCPTTQALLSWTAALRLASWEKSRLEEIYTAHLMRITLNDGRDAPTPLHNGRLEGWVRIRIAGQTDWKRLWMIVTAGGNSQDGASVSSADHPPGSPPVLRKKRISNIFSREQDHVRTAPSKPTIQVFTSNKPKDKKKAILTVRDVTQAFAVYPERPELISRSTLFKVEGLLGDEETAAHMRNREGWLLVMPELEGNSSRASEMLKWLIAIHDAFEMYGRPRMYSWDPRDPRSLMFAYPIGPQKDLLFLDRELAENLDPRDERTSSTRAQLQHILWDRMRGSPENSQTPPAPAPNGPPTLPPLQQSPPMATPSPPVLDISKPMQLGPLSFETSRTEQDLPALPPRMLTPITERSDARNSRSISGEPINGALAQTSRPATADQNGHIPPHDQAQAEEGDATVFGMGMSSSPTSTSPVQSASAYTGTANTRQNSSFEHDPRASRRSDDSYGMATGSRPDSKLSHFGLRQPNSPSSQFQTFEASDVPSQVPQSPQMGRQSPASFSQTGQRPPQFSHPSVTSAATTGSRPASPRPNSMRSSSFDVPTQGARPSSPHFSVLTSPHSVLDSPVARRPGSRLSTVQDLASPGASLQSGNATTPGAPAGPPPGYPLPPVPNQSPRAATFQSNAIAQPSPPPPATSPSVPASFMPPSPPAMQASSSSSSVPRSLPPQPIPKDDSADEELMREAGALYYMQHIQQDQPHGPRRQLPPSPGDNPESSSSSSSSYSPSAATSPGMQSPNNLVSPVGSSYFSPRASQSGSYNAQVVPGRSGQSPDAAPAAFSPRMANTPPMRKPSGARAVPVSKTVAAQREQQQPPPRPPSDVEEDNEDDDMSDEQYSDEAMHAPRQLPPRMAAAAENSMHDSDAADALAALSFLEREDAPEPHRPAPQAYASPPPPPPVPQVVEPRATSPQASAEGPVRSSFAPSKQASQRKAQAQAQQAAQQAAAHKPGRANGRKKKMRDPGAWGESSDEEEEEEEEEEEDEEDADSDGEPAPRDKARQEQVMPSSSSQLGYPQRGASPARPPTEHNGYPTPAGRPPRDLPQVPNSFSQSQFGSEDYLGPQPRRIVSDQYSEAGRRSMYPEGPRRQASPQTQFRPQSEFAPQPQQLAAARQNMWSQVLEKPGQLPEHKSDTFVQIEPPSQTMTKAFAPHGLLSAGLQDKHDRSAKRQEELARESGASLINVPNKPPPPQTGLLGAVTAHERERKREGGLGAALTEREREKRLAEERQRKLDEYQRMQLDQMQQGGSMYGGMGMPPQFSGFNPMMGNPMMMGMNPMMTGGWGYPGMVNPQHMFAAQQAAQAYQQAMMAFSTAGSQVGGNEAAAAPMNPMMTGMSMGAGFDPRMSMMGMPMMSPSMTGLNTPGMGQGMMGQGLSPMATGMGQGMGGMGMSMGGMGMGPQMTGGSGFDPRYSPANDAGLQPPSDGGPSRPYSQNSSAHGQGSPAAPRPAEAADEPPRRVPADVR